MFDGSALEVADLIALLNTDTNLANLKERDLSHESIRPGRRAASILSF